MLAANKYTYLKATNADIDEIEALYESVHSYCETNKNYPGWVRDLYPTRETAEDALLANTLFVVKMAGTIVATFILSHDPEPGYGDIAWGSEDDYSKIFVVHTLAVHPDYFGQHIAKNIVNFILEYGKKENMLEIRLDSYAGNLPALKLYEGAGFEYKGTVDLGHADIGLYDFRLYQYILEDK